VLAVSAQSPLWLVVPAQSPLWLVVSAVLLGGYVLALTLVPRVWPDRSNVAVMGRARAAWFEKLWAEGPPILFVQTYRNWLIGLNVLASAALVGGLGAMSFALGGAASQSAGFDGVAWWVDGGPSWQARLVVLGVVQLAAFANFLLAVRSFNQAAILVAVPHDHVPTAALGVSVLRAAHLHHTAAVRILCLSLPAALWVFGAELLFAGMLATVAFLARVDFRFGR